MQNDAALTRAQHRLLSALRQWQEDGGNPPTLAQLCDYLGLRSKGSMHKQVQALVDAGLVEPMAGLARGVRLTAAAQDARPTLPLLGRIAAGRPIEATFDSERIDIPPSLCPRGHAYVLEVRGESMIDAGILDGDRVIIDADRQARRGDIVVALIDGREATLKRLGRVGPPLVLEAANPNYPAQILDPARVQFQGVLHALWRQY
ncbi:MAG: transcriptional repressor LexA [Xanthomonadales bacterium]|nr:transcriptional repressor LexA [Xanthomonadales bacterium]